MITFTMGNRDYPPVARKDSRIVHSSPEPFNGSARVRPEVVYMYLMRQ